MNLQQKKQIGYEIVFKLKKYSFESMEKQNIIFESISGNKLINKDTKNWYIVNTDFWPNDFESDFLELANIMNEYADGKIK